MHRFPMKVSPSIPFGNMKVMTSMSVTERFGAIIVRQIPDEFTSGERPPEEAWAHSEKTLGPAWALTFDSDEAARDIANLCNELADRMVEERERFRAHCK